MGRRRFVAVNRVIAMRTSMLRASRWPGRARTGGFLAELRAGCAFPSLEGPCSGHPHDGEARSLETTNNFMF